MCSQFADDERKSRRDVFLRTELCGWSAAAKHRTCYRTKRTTLASLECGTCLFRSNLFPVNPGQLDNHWTRERDTHRERQREGVGEREGEKVKDVFVNTGSSPHRHEWHPNVKRWLEIWKSLLGTDDTALAPPGSFKRRGENKRDGDERGKNKKHIFLFPRGSFCPFFFSSFTLDSTFRVKLPPETWGLHPLSKIVLMAAGPLWECAGKPSCVDVWWCCDLFTWEKTNGADGNTSAFWESGCLWHFLFFGQLRE